MADPLLGKTEEITDVLTPEGIRSGQFQKGQVLKFDYEGSITCLKITQIFKHKGRAWAKHIELMSQQVVASHYGHNVDSTKEAIDEHGKPYCQDCEVTVDQPSTEDGEVKAADRRDHELSDGTRIPDQE